MNPLIIILLVIVILCLGYVVFLMQKNGKNHEEVSKIDLLTQSIQQDKDNRHRDMDVLRKQIYEQTESLQRQFDRVNKTVDTKLSDSSKQLNERLDKSSHVIGNLSKELGKMSEMGSRIENLDKILRAPKGRGSLGEESLEEILRSVFPTNIWERQFDMGGGLVVDAVIKTANGNIPIDAKYPLEAYERIMKSENEQERLHAQRDFQRDVKKRIDEVNKYIQTQKGTVDFAILFLPNESIYYEAQVMDAVISEYARKKKVLLTGPNTMLYALQVVFQAYQSQEFAKEAQKALSQLQGVKQIAEKMDDELQVMAKHLHNATSKLSDTQTINSKLQGQIDSVVAIQPSLEKAEKQSTLL